MPYIDPTQQRRLVAVDTKVNVRQTVTTVFLAVTIVSAVVAAIAAIVDSLGA